MLRNCNTCSTNNNLLGCSSARWINSMKSGPGAFVALSQGKKYIHSPSLSVGLLWYHNQCPFLPLLLTFLSHYVCFISCSWILSACPSRRKATLAFSMLSAFRCCYLSTVLWKGTNNLSDAANQRYSLWLNSPFMIIFHQRFDTHIFLSSFFFNGTAP